MARRLGLLAPPAVRIPCALLSGAPAPPIDLETRELHQDRDERGECGRELGGHDSAVELFHRGH
jgi:hypothetical protein